MRFSIIVITLLILTIPVHGQMSQGSPFVQTPEMIYSFGQKYNSWSVAAGIGPVFMYSDLREYTLFPDRDVHFGSSVWVTKHLVPAFAVELQYLQSDMSGVEGRYGFEGDLIDLSVNGIAIINQMLPDPGPVNDHWNFYLKIGVGSTLFRSRLLHRETGDVVRRNEIYDTENSDYVVLGYDKSDAGQTSSRQKEIVVPFGVGIMYRINHSFDVGLESILRFSAADNLDNILTGATNDRYLFTALNLSYKFGDKERRHMRWTYRAEGMDMFGRKQKSRIEEEIRRLSEDIAEYEANRPVHKDSVVITETLKVVYGNYNVRTIFFPPGVPRDFNPADQLLMGKVAIELHQYPEKKVWLYGYSDTVGNEDDNFELSRQRCLAVKNFLVRELGIESSRIEIVPKGEKDPLSPVEELSPRGLQMVNRRVDLLVK